MPNANSSAFVWPWCSSEAAENLGPTAPTVPTAPATLAPSSDSVVLNGRTMTVVGERLCWSDALLYCRRHHWDLLSLHSKEEQAEAAQLLSRATFVITDGVWLGLRRYNRSMGRWHYLLKLVLLHPPGAFIIQVDQKRPKEWNMLRGDMTPYFIV